MIFDVITLFPQMFDALTQYGITRRAAEQGNYVLKTWNPRDFTTDNYRTIDDRPYGGGPGMVMLAEPLAAAISAAKQRQAASGVKKSRVVYLSPQGRLLTHSVVKELVAQADEGLILLAGRYEGIDERLIRQYVDDRDFHRRLCVVRWRVGGDGVDRQSGAATARCIGRCRIGRAGIVRAGLAGLPALYPPGNV